jgi:hypothetical protein
MDSATFIVFGCGGFLGTTLTCLSNKSVHNTYPCRVKQLVLKLNFWKICLEMLQLFPRSNYGLTIG